MKQETLWFNGMYIFLGLLAVFAIVITLYPSLAQFLMFPLAILIGLAILILLKEVMNHTKPKSDLK